MTSELRDRIASTIWDHLRPEVDTTPIADDILALPELAALQRERDALREAAAPFISAALYGVATYEAVKTANLMKNGLSIYETVYVGAGSHAAESRISYSDWGKLAKLADKDARTALGIGEPPLP